MGLRFAPSIAFLPDAMPENARHIEELLARTQAEDAERAAASSGAQFAGEADPYRKPREIEPDEDDDELDEDEPRA